ncbi:MAG TPA: hypothetical protein VGT44_12190 [Ktedonobacteraceae bacterium]|nr:hypothetical protein [Ktedonobacteraceae bacterium]
MFSTNDEQHQNRSARLTRLQCAAGVLAITLAAFSLLCIHSFATPVLASAGSGQTAAATTSSQGPLDDDTQTVIPSQTPTGNPSPTVTNTPSATATKTSTPSPTATHPATPVPTSTRPPVATARPSSTVVGKQTPSPVASSISIGAQGAGANVTPVVSVSSAQSNQSNQPTNQPDSISPLIYFAVALACLGLLGMLLKIWWSAMRSWLWYSRPSPKLPSQAKMARNARPTHHQQNPLIAQRTVNLAVPYVPTIPNTPYVLPNPNTPYALQGSAGPNNISPATPYGIAIANAPTTEHAIATPSGTLFRDYFAAAQRQSQSNQTGNTSVSIDPNAQALIEPYVY